MRARRAALVLLFLAAPAGARDDLDDVLGGFDEEDQSFEIREAASEPGERWWDLSGSYELSGSWNLRSHRSATGTDYRGLQRLRNRLNLQLDLEPRDDWKLRLEGWGFWDAAYRLRDRDAYTREVRNTYELDAELGEAWIAGRLARNLDLKVGRQVVVWGGSETLRVLDVLNPLDNREPGRVDLEDLRRPSGMLRVDVFRDAWTWTGVAIPEIRFDASPVVGSDFFAGSAAPPERQPSGFGDLELGTALVGTFSGWDVSFHAARFWDDTPRLADDGAHLVHDRLWMVGAGSNLTRGSWLFKTELAWLDGLGFAGTRDEKARFDALLGAEYYGWIDTTVVLEVVNRHVFDAPPGVRGDAQQIALRVTRNFWNDTLHLTGLAFLLGWNGGEGSILRLDLSYDLRDALRIGVGILLYQTGEEPPLDAWGRNDRLIFNARWSF